MRQRFLPTCLAAFLSTLAFAQPTYRVGTHLIQVDVTVRTDKDVVPGLTRDDFTVQNKRKTQNIAVFSVTNRNGPKHRHPTLIANIASNRINKSREKSKNETETLFDRLNTPDPMDQANARTKVLALLRSLKPADRVAFYSLYDTLTPVQEFLDSPERLAGAAARMDAQGGAGGDSLDLALRDALNPAQSINVVARVQITAAAFRSIARRLSGIPGRKTLLWLTSSVPLTYGTDVSRRSDDQAEVDSLVRILSDANIVLYAIDVRGVGTSFTQPASDKPVEGGLMARAGSRIAVDQEVIQSANSLSGDQGLQLIAEQTGGKAYLNVNDVSIPLREALDFADATYTLGFYVDEKALDGKVHDLSVKIARRPEANGAKVYARKNYLAAAAAPQHAGIHELAADKLDATQIGVMAATAPDPSRPGIHVAQVRVSGADLQFERRGDKWTASFDLGLALEAGGRSTDVSVKTIQLPELTEDQLRQAFVGGLDIDNTIPSPSQAGMLRVVVQDKLSGAAGSVRVPIAPQ